MLSFIKDANRASPQAHRQAEQLALMSQELEACNSNDTFLAKLEHDGHYRSKLARQIKPRSGSAPVSLFVADS